MSLASPSPASASTPIQPRNRQPPRLPLPPTARAAALVARRQQSAPPPRLNLSVSERIRGPQMSSTTGVPRLEDRASQPTNRPAFSIFDISGAIRVGDTRIHSNGIVFGNHSYEMSIEDFTLLEDLGEGNYGSVKRAIHRPSGVVMAMKETKVSFESSETKRIIQELDILHRAKAPNIVQFNGAFTAESRVYNLMEYMDAGSLDKLTFKPRAVYQVGNEQLTWTLIPEPVLARICAGIVKGLKALKDNLDVMHRDVKPTNILMNSRGEVKLCDFGVSKQLERSLAKTNIGCQSYMAPERILDEHKQHGAGEYTVAADVWSLGLSVVEIAMGEYPYAESCRDVFSQLSHILHGDLPSLPRGYSPLADDWVLSCLSRNVAQRATYEQLLRHAFLKDEEQRDVDMAGWVAVAMKFKGSKCIRSPPKTEYDGI